MLTLGASQKKFLCLIAWLHSTPAKAAGKALGEVEVHWDVVHSCC